MAISFSQSRFLADFGANWEGVMRIARGESADEHSGAPITPPRKPRSLRRTSSWQTMWPDGLREPWAMTGAARDLSTDWRGTATVLQQERVDLRLTPDMAIERIDQDGHAKELSSLLGIDLATGYRKKLAALSRSGIAPLLHRLLSDLPGAAYVAPHGWVNWHPDWVEEFRQASLAERIEAPARDICIGLRRGSDALDSEGRQRPNYNTLSLAPSEDTVEDSLAWHRFYAADVPNQRRAKRVDVWMENGRLIADIGFRDSSGICGAIDHRAVLHEYRVRSVFETANFRIESIDVEPVSLPYRFCMSAPETAQHLIGMSAFEISAAISTQLQGPLGCTHLNGVLHSLRDVAQLQRLLPGSEPIDLR